MSVAPSPEVAAEAPPQASARPLRVLFFMEYLGRYLRFFDSVIRELLDRGHEVHLVFERETMLVRAAYAEFGLAAPRLNREPDDHIGLELGFVATLCVRGMDALDDGDDAELTRLVRGIRSFLADHLLVWAPACLTQAAEGATTHFYQGVAALGLGALAAAEDAFLRVP